MSKRERMSPRMQREEKHQSDVSVQIDDSYAKRWLTLNPKEFKAIVAKISQRLFELESQANQAYDDEKKRGDDLFGKYEKLTKEYNELKYNMETNEKLIAERIQYILSLGGKAAAPDNEQLIELLKDMNIEIYWDSSDAPLTDAAMFTEYAVDEESMTGVKPCLVRNGSVYVKGIRLIKN